MLNPIIDSQQNTQWLAAYLYYAEPWNSFLVKAVKPFVELVLSRQWAQQFFFIRYWEKGPHIRLRFKVNSEENRQQITSTLINHFQSYFRNFPSHRQDPPNTLDWFPNHSIQWLPYQPEIERYGGPIGIMLSEILFEASSKSILEIFEQNIQWDYNRAMGVVLQIHLGFAHAMGMSIIETQKFFFYVFQRWLPKSYHRIGENLSQKQLTERHIEVLKAFEISFLNQKQILNKFIQSIWKGLELNIEFEQAWYNTWLENVRQIKIRFEKASNDGLLKIPDNYQLPKEDSFLYNDKSVLWFIYESHIHMINNRIGLLNRDEGYIGYLIANGLAEFYKSTSA